MSGEKWKQWVAFWKLKDSLKRRGAIQETTIGMSHVRLMRARDLIEVTIEMLKEDQAAPLCDDPNCSRCMKPSQEIARAREAKEC